MPGGGGTPTPIKVRNLQFRWCSAAAFATPFTNKWKEDAEKKPLAQTQYWMLGSVSTRVRQAAIIISTQLQLIVFCVCVCFRTMEEGTVLVSAWCSGKRWTGTLPSSLSPLLLGQLFFRQLDPSTRSTDANTCVGSPTRKCCDVFMIQFPSSTALIDGCVPDFEQQSQNLLENFDWVIFRRCSKSRFQFSFPVGDWVQFFFFWLTRLVGSKNLNPDHKKKCSFFTSKDKKIV